MGKVRYAPWIFDFETYRNLCCVTFLSLDNDETKVFVIDKNRHDAEEIAKFVKSKTLIGYNSKTFDNIILNYIIKNPKASSEEIARVSSKIISTQSSIKPMEFYSLFRDYLRNDDYRGIDLMRMLFSKKLRVGLKELECSLNFKNVEELPYPFDAILEEDQKQRVILYNYNDCEATKLVLQSSLDAIKLRKWTKDNFGVDGYSLDGVNLGVKILEKKLAERLGNNDFSKTSTTRRSVEIKDIIYPFVKFQTKDFQQILKNYQKLKVYKYFDKEANREKWSKYKAEPQIGPYIYKYGLGGLHFDTKCKAWYSSDEFEVLSVDVASFYPSQVREYGKTLRCKPEHLPDEFVDVYVEVIEERLRAKASGDDIKNETYKLSINGAFGNMSNEHSWLCDVRALLTITVNGQLMLSMLCERLMLHKIQLIDVNTDGVYLYLHKSQREIFDKICKEWSEQCRMELEETKFEKMFFLTTADYFGTYMKKGKELVKEKGCFITTPRLGKGMEFPIIYNAVKHHFLEGKPFEEFIRVSTNILDFCSYKKLKKDYTCFWKGDKQQRVNRYYASREGAHLYRRKWDKKKNRYQIDHILKDAPVLLLNKLDEKHINERGIYYPYYLSKARQIITEMDGARGQTSMF